MKKPPIKATYKVTPNRFCGKQGRSGTPKGNQNNLRHGLRAGQLPKDAKYIEYRLNAFRRTLEQAVLVIKGEVSIPDAATIQTALRWERHGCLAQRWLNKKYAELKPTDLLQFSREIARASTERDKALAMLKLDRDAKDSVIDALYSRPAIINDGKDSNEPT
jgi:hypothetical protein